MPEEIPACEVSYLHCSIPGKLGGSLPVSLPLWQLGRLHRCSRWKQRAEIRVSPAVHADVQSFPAQQSQLSLNCLPVSANWICGLRLSQVGSPKNIFMHMKEGVWVLFWKALILLGPANLVGHDFNLYYTLGRPQAVNVWTFAAFTSEKQGRLCFCRAPPSAPSLESHADAGRHLGLQVCSCGPVGAGFPRLLPDPGSQSGIANAGDPVCSQGSGKGCLMPGSRTSRTKTRLVHLGRVWP